MDSELKKRYIQVLFRFRKSGLDFPKIADVSMMELFVMAGLSNNNFCDGKRVDLTQIKGHTHTTKAAISLMFTSLEKKGYVIREIDKSNRRKITVVLTDAGNQVLENAKVKIDLLLDKTFTRFGEDKAWQLITLLNELSDVSDQLKQEMLPSKDQ